MLRTGVRNYSLKFLLFIIIIFLSEGVVYSQRTGSIRGFVEDSTTNEVLSYCNIFIKELSIGTSTNDRGFFFIPSLPAFRKYTIRFLISDTKTINVNVYEDQIQQWIFS
jgi:hypothetical protein